jgi:hypothetical protein
MYDQLRQRGKEFNIVFADRTLLSNSRLALEASEYARDRGKYCRKDLSDRRADFYHQREVQDCGCSAHSGIPRNLRQNRELRLIKHAIKKF